eukprot:11091452-Lingulodinium_polyedra.AAC.1
MSGGTEVVNITKEDDLTRRCTVECVVGLLRGPRGVLCYRGPCTGGAPWQRVNLAKGRAKGCEDM